MESELKARARRIWEEIFPAGDAEALAAVIAPESIDHQARPDEPQGLEGAIRTMHWLRRVFSDQRWEIRNVISEGDAVVVYATHRARHTGELMGIPPTGNRLSITGIDMFRLADGKIVESWVVADALGMLQQLGVIPPMGPPPQ